MGSKKNQLAGIELEVAREYERRRKRRKRYPEGGQTKIAEERKAGNRKRVPVPEGKSLKEITETDRHDPGFRSPAGRPRKWEAIDGEPLKEPENWREVIRKAYQKKENDRRARVRKWEAQVVVAQKTLRSHAKKKNKEIDIYDEEKLIAENILNLDEWDNEELIRGYRRNRRGDFGAPPKYIPREIQQEAFRRLVNRGERKLKEAYYRTIEGLIELAHNASSEKVRLDAQKELLNRVIGKVPDRMLVAREEPWEGILADALVPMDEAPVDLYPTAGGAFGIDPIDASDINEPPDEGGVETPGPPAAGGVPEQRSAPPPSPLDEEN